MLNSIASLTRSSSEARDGLLIPVKEVAIGIIAEGFSLRPSSPAFVSEVCAASLAAIDGFTVVGGKCVGATGIDSMEPNNEELVVSAYSESEDGSF